MRKEYTFLLICGLFISIFSVNCQNSSSESYISEDVSELKPGEQTGIKAWD